MKATHIDLYDPDEFVDGTPIEGFDWLREHEPLSWHPAGDHGGFWSLVRFEDCYNAGRDWQTFSSARGALIEDATGGSELMMLNMDPPMHTKLRSLVNKGFTPRRVASLEDSVREIAAGLIDQHLPKGEADFVDIAEDLPLQVIAEMLGVPHEDRRKVITWSNTMVGLDDPEYGTSIEGATQAAMEMYMYWEWLCEQRREHRREDLISALLESEVEGQKLSNVEIDVFLLLLAVAGNETTRNLISGGMDQLLQNPGQWQRLLERPELLHTGVEEMLRYITPVMHFRRTATRDVEMHGQTIKQGDKVVLWYIAANRDPKMFPEPHRFDVGRSPNEHIGFGTGGPHFCLGANLARLEIRIMFEELLKRVPDIEPAGPAAHLRSNFINGIKHLPVKFAPRNP